jgi:hypothetical protein
MGTIPLSYLTPIFRIVAGNVESRQQVPEDPGDGLEMADD